jgi:hypothetical protein
LPHSGEARLGRLIRNNLHSTFGPNRAAVNEYLNPRDRGIGRSAHRIAKCHGAACHSGAVGRGEDRRYGRQLLRHIDGSTLPASFFVGKLHRLGLIHGFENPVNYIRTVIGGAETGGGEEVCCCRRPLVHVPADQLFSAWGTVVVTGWCPQGPSPAIIVREKGKELFAVSDSIPADGAVTEGSHRQVPVA